MTACSAFAPLKALIFDMDGTLYRNRRLDRLYELSLYQAVSLRQSLTLTQARRVFDEKQSALAERLGSPPSKLYTLSQLGISDQYWARTVGRIQVAEVLKPQPRLATTLKNLSRRFRLGLVTNNHRRNTLETLGALGVTDCFDDVMTLSESRRFKPAPELYQAMAERLAVDPGDCLSIGDRYHLDLEPAAAVGMQTLLVQRLQDIYQLPGHCRVKPGLRLAADTRSAQRAAVEAASRSLNAGRLAVLPTDTVYGLAARPDPAAIRWIYRAKGRREDQPLVLLLSDPEEAGRYAAVSAKARQAMAKHWPGALTMVLPAKRGTSWGRVTRGGGTVALRVPDHALMRAVIRRCGGALATTSANVSGRPAIADLRRLDEAILGFADRVVDAGVARVGMPSTVAAFQGSQVRILRQGSVRLG